MYITETFRAPETTAGELFWLPPYIQLSKSVYDTYTRTGETSQRTRHISNCAARWGITRRCAEAILTGEAIIEKDPLFITVRRPVVEA